MSFINNKIVTATDFTGKCMLSNGKELKNIKIKKTTVENSAGEVSCVKYNVDYNGAFFISLEGRDEEFDNLVELVSWLRHNLPGRSDP